MLVFRGEKFSGNINIMVCLGSFFVKGFAGKTGCTKEDLMIFFVKWKVNGFGTE